ncbi:MAG TPA: hypothetical protein VIT18_02300 [Terrimicrobiaceae bacterium]
MKKLDRHNSDELRQTLLGELRTLRQTVREAGEGFILRKEGEIEALLSYLLEMRPSQVEKFGKSWLRESRDLSIKPTKGRIKDLRRIDSLLEDLLNRVIEVDAPAKVPARAKKPLPQPEVTNSAVTSVSGEL